MKIEIDQSWKIEKTNKATVLAFSNKKSFALKIPSKIKRQLQEMFRRQGQPTLFVYRTFAAGIFLLIKDHLKKITYIVIDIEYPGKEPLIKEILLELLRKYKLKEPEIAFKRIGEKPKVHYAAHNVFTGKKKADKIVSFEELRELVIKKDRGHKR